MWLSCGQRGQCLLITLLQDGQGPRVARWPVMEALPTPQRQAVGPSGVGGEQAEGALKMVPWPDLLRPRASETLIHTGQEGSYHQPSSYYEPGTVLYISSWLPAREGF